MKKYLSEIIGTFVLVLFGCGVAVFTNADIVATSLAFGLAIVALAYVIGPVSGCHVNPAITLSMLIDKRISLKDAILYLVSQVIGAFLGSFLLMYIVKSANIGTLEFVGLGQNGFGASSAVGIGTLCALVVEVVLTFVFVFAVLGVTADSKKSSVAPIVIGLTLAFVHLLGIRLTGTSVNPARSFAPATLMATFGKTGLCFEQVWVFVVGPFVGAILAALVYKFIKVPEKKVEVVAEVKAPEKKVQAPAKKAPAKKTVKKAK